MQNNRPLHPPLSPPSSKKSYAVSCTQPLFVQGRTVPPAQQWGGVRPGVVTGITRAYKSCSPHAWWFYRSRWFLLIQIYFCIRAGFLTSQQYVRNRAMADNNQPAAKAATTINDLPFDLKIKASTCSPHKLLDKPQDHTCARSSRWCILYHFYISPILCPPSCHRLRPTSLLLTSPVWPAPPPPITKSANSQTCGSRS